MSAILGFSLLIGGGSFLIVRHLLKQQVNNQLDLDLKWTLLALKQPLDDVIKNLQLLVKHPLLANGLTDSVGRDTYLQTFFFGHSLAKRPNGALLLTDFNGRPLLTTSESLNNWAENSSLVRQVLHSGRYVIEFNENNNLIFIFPVIFPPTGSTEGLIVYSLDIKQLVLDVSKSIGSLLSISYGGQTVSSAPLTNEQLIRRSTPLHLDGEVDNFDVKVTVAYSEHLIMSPLYRMVEIYFFSALILFLLAFGLSKNLSRNILKGLQKLIKQADSISSAEDLPEQTALITGDIEIERLSYAFNSLLERLHQSYSNLEVRVAERTVDLAVAQENASQSAAYARSLIEASLDPLVIISASGNVADVNKATEKVIGLQREQLIGHEFARYLTEPEKVLSGYQQVFTEGEIIDFPLSLRHVSGHTTDVLFNASLYHNINGKVEGILATARDVTQQRQIEYALRQAKQTAEEASKAKSNFLANMSHEIRTPMNAIIGLTELALDTELNSKQRDYLNKIQQSSTSLLGIINDILDFSKIEAGKIDIEHSVFNVEDLLQDIGDLFVSLIEMKGMELFLEITPGIPAQLIGDALRIRQILNNLINNAVKFTDHGEINVKVDVRGHDDEFYNVRFSVEDTGIGLAQSEMTRLFKPFIQADSSISRKFGGTGLGLVICKQLVELMGGDISVSSRLGEGSTFSFTLPLKADLSENNVRQLPVISNQRVLVVDDMETSCLILQRYLKDWGFEVMTASSGMEGIEKIRQADQEHQPFGLLVVDWKMPGMDGLELTEKIAVWSRQVHTPYVPTIIMAASHNRETLLKDPRYVLTKTEAILNKPVAISGLFNALLAIYQPYLEVQEKAAPAKISPFDRAKPIRGCCILLVEDNAINQQIAKEFLQKSGLKVIAAENGLEAITWVQREHFDAVLMDLQMPLMDGFEATRQIRKIWTADELPIIAMTAAAMQHDREACVKADMNDHIAKPINSGKLIDILLQWIPCKNPGLSDVTGTGGAKNSVIKTPEGFDFNNILPLLENDPGQLLRLLAMFRESFSSAGHSISQSLSQGELVCAQQQLHQLKGVAGNIGAMEFCKLSQTFEEQLKHNTIDQGTFDAWLSAFKKNMETIDELIGTQAQTDKSSDSAQGKLQPLVIKLDELLSQNGYVSADLLMTIESLVAPRHRELLKAMTRSIKQLDYQAARGILTKLSGLEKGGIQ